MNEALHCFNQARKDSEWGERALFSMVEICLNPENEMLGGETLKSVEGVSSRCAAYTLQSISTNACF